MTAALTGRRGRPGDEQRKGVLRLISEDELDRYRIEGIKVRVIRDADPVNDVKGIVLAWNDEQVMIRKQNRKIVKLDRNYRIQPWDMERQEE